MNQLAVKDQMDALLSEPLSSVLHRENFTFDELAAPFEKSIVLVGAGGLGRKTLNGLRQVGIEPLAFADNDPSLWGKAINGVQVFSPQVAAKKYGQSAAFVITIWRAKSKDRMAGHQKQLLDIKCLKTIPFSYLYWKYPTIFLPYYAVDMPNKVFEQADEVRKAFSLWADGESQNEYLAQVKWRILMDWDNLPSPVSHELYFPQDLTNMDPDDEFVDCGAYDGDTIRDLLHLQGEAIKKITAFEPDPVNFRKLHDFVSKLPVNLREKLVIYQLATGAKKRKARFNATGTEASEIGFGDLEVDCVALDEILADDRPSYIKMDIEGSEIETLIGAQAIIRKNLPVLAISAYHHQDHLWRIPLLIHSFSDHYRFFLRPHFLEVWDLVCYGIPDNRLKLR